jgi:hypothetical protein
MRKGHELAQSNDIGKLKTKLTSIFEDIAFSPAVDPSDGKGLMGFNHAQCGELLCSVDTDWSDPTYVPALSAFPF